MRYRLAAFAPFLIVSVWYPLAMGFPIRAKNIDERNGPSVMSRTNHQGIERRTLADYTNYDQFYDHQLPQTSETEYSTITFGNLPEPQRYKALDTAIRHPSNSLVGINANRFSGNFVPGSLDDLPAEAPQSPERVDYSSPVTYDTPEKFRAAFQESVNDTRFQSMVWRAVLGAKRVRVYFRNLEGFLTLQRVSKGTEEFKAEWNPNGLFADVVNDLKRRAYHPVFDVFWGERSVLEFGKLVEPAQPSGPPLSTWDNTNLSQ